MASVSPAFACVATAEQLRAYLMGLCPRDTLARVRACPDPAPVPEGLVDIRIAAPAVVLLDAPVWSDPELRFLVRPEVAERLARVVQVLPSDLRLGFWEGLRPLAVQRTLWGRGLEYLRGALPSAADPELESLLEQYVARPDGKRPPHSTGSAVDIAPVDAFGRIMTPEDAWGRVAVDLLARALRDSGLAHYRPEWWHWSYGDEEWARAYDCAPLAFAATPEFDGPGGGI
ncbi:MAG: hypothetical protein ACK47B_06200 [Armatimonadota bacterium]